MARNDHLKFCSERGRLLDLMNAASRDYAALVSDLTSGMADISELEYQRVRGEIEGARRDAEHAREALLQHRREPGC